MTNLQNSRFFRSNCDKNLQKHSKLDQNYREQQNTATSDKCEKHKNLRVISKAPNFKNIWDRNLK